MMVEQKMAFSVQVSKTCCCHSEVAQFLILASRTPLSNIFKQKVLIKARSQSSRLSSFTDIPTGDLMVLTHFQCLI